MTLLPGNINRSRKDLSPELMWTGTNWAEGPCWLPTEGKLLFSDVVSSAQYLLDPDTKQVELFRHHSGNGNGNAVDHVNHRHRYYGFYPPELEDLADYIVLTCEHGRRCVSASVPPHAIERYIARYGNDSSLAARTGHVAEREDSPDKKNGKNNQSSDIAVADMQLDGKSRATAMVPSYMMITNKIVVEKFQSFRFNSPNDIVIRPTDGTIWFTDPPYGILSNKEGYQAGSQMNGCYVYCLYPTHLCSVVERTGPKGEPLPLIPREELDSIHHTAINVLNSNYQVLRIAVVDAIRPNGLAFSPDGMRLYVADCSSEDFKFRDGRREIRVYDLIDGGEQESTAEQFTKEGAVVETVTLRYRETRAINGRQFCSISPGIPDGFRLDAEGYVYTSCADAIIVYDPDGVEVNRVVLPERVSNCSFGGKDGHDLYVSADHSIYRIRF